MLEKNLFSSTSLNILVRARTKVRGGIEKKRNNRKSMLKKKKRYVKCKWKELREAARLALELQNLGGQFQID